MPASCGFEDARLLAGDLLITLNCHCVPGSWNPSGRLTAIAEWIRRRTASRRSAWVALQEVFLPEHRDLLAAALPHMWVSPILNQQQAARANAVPSVVPPFVRVGSTCVPGGVVVCSVQPPVGDAVSTTFRASSQLDGMSLKGAVVVPLRKDLWLLATHMQSLYFDWNRARVEQVRDIARLVDRAVPTDATVLYAGDWNKIDGDVLASQLGPGVVALRCRGDCPTFGRHQVDHILVRGATTRCTTQMATDVVVDGVSGLTDHRALVCEWATAD